MLPCPRTMCARHALALTPLECAAERRFRPVGRDCSPATTFLARSFHALQQECFTTRYHSEGCSLSSSPSPLALPGGAHSGVNLGYALPEQSTAQLQPRPCGSPARRAP